MAAGGVAAGGSSAGAATSADPFDAGPYARLHIALGLTGPGALRVARRALVAAMIAWLPLVILAAMEGLALRADPRESMLLDVAAHARYLVATPLFVLAEVACLPRLAMIAHHFRAAGIIQDSESSKYENVLDSTRRLLASQRAELIIVAVAFATTIALGRVWYPVAMSTWVAPIVGGIRTVSYAGWWRTLVSQPLFAILLLMWLWRLVVWALFLWRVSHLRLRLVASHPDLNGGLAFVASSLRAFPLFAFAFAAPMAGGSANGLLYGSEQLPTFGYVVAGAVTVVLILCAAPLLVFFAPLLRLHVRGVFEYGQLAGEVGRRFEESWILPGKTIDTSALAAPDFSATTDLYSVVANVRAMRLVPLDVRGIVPILIAALLPFVPVLLVTVPVQQVLEAILKLLR